MEAEERLLDCLQNGRPILFLGAGFSYKALNLNYSRQYKLV